MSKEPLYPHKPKTPPIYQGDLLELKKLANKILNLNNSWNIRTAVDIAESNPQISEQVRKNLREMLVLAYKVDKELYTIVETRI